MVHLRMDLSTAFAIRCKDLLVNCLMNGVVRSGCCDSRGPGSVQEGSSNATASIA